MILPSRGRSIVAVYCTPLSSQITVYSVGNILSAELLLGSGTSSQCSQPPARTDNTSGPLIQQ